MPELELNNKGTNQMIVLDGIESFVCSFSFVYNYISRKMGSGPFLTLSCMEWLSENKDFCNFFNIRHALCTRSSVNV